MTLELALGKVYSTSDDFDAMIIIDNFIENVVKCIKNNPLDMSKAGLDLKELLKVNQML